MRRKKKGKEIDIQLPQFTAKTRAYPEHAAGKNATLESRIDMLEKNIKIVHCRISTIQEEMDCEFKKITDSFTTDSQEKKYKISVVDTKLKNAATGGIHISMIGALLLFFGVILSSASPEIVSFLK